jgi:hypothetical protein
MRKSPAPLTAALVIVILAGYFGAYYNLVGRRINFRPRYRVGESAAKESVARRFFAPAHYADFMLRPDYWDMHRAFAKQRN